MAMSCLHVTVIPLALLAFIFFIVAMVSNHWITVTDCIYPLTGEKVTIDFSAGLSSKCVNGDCDNIMEGPQWMDPFKNRAGWCQTNGKHSAWFPGDNFCETYYKCDIDGTTLESGTCAAGEQFDVYSRECTSSVPKCGCHDLRCKGLVADNNRAYRKDKLCNTWYQCKQNSITNMLMYTSGSCASGNLYDDRTSVAGGQKCVLTASAPADCMDANCVANDNGLTKVVVTDSTVCEKYYQCIGGHQQNSQTCTAGTNTVHLGPTGVAGFGTCITKTSWQPVAQITTCQDPKCKASLKSKLVVATFCQNYYSCSAGKMISFQSCTLPNIYFDEATEQCTSTKPAACKDYRCLTQSNGYTTLSRADGYKKVDVACKGWTRCSNGGKTYSTGTCSTTGQTINEAAPDSGTAPCTTPQKDPQCENTLCTGKSAGYVVVKSPECQKYYECNGDGTLKQAEASCGGATVNVFVLGKSVHTNCDETTTSGSTSCWDPRCSTLDAGHTNTVYAYSNGIIADGKNKRDCQQYYKCTTGFYQDMDCGANSYFDKTNKVCTSTLPSNCVDKRCHGRANGKHLRPDGDATCIDYKVCGSDKQTSTSSCGKTTGGTQKLLNSVTRACEDPDTLGVPAGCVVRVDGGWSPWSLWSMCYVNATHTPDVEPSVGMQIRERACICPAPSATGSACEGEKKDGAVCYICSPEQGWLGGARAGIGLALACSIMTLFWAIWVNVSKKCYAANATIFHAFVSVIAGLVGAIMYIGNQPDIGYACTVEGGWGYIMAILGVILSIITMIIAIVVSVKSRNRVHSASNIKLQEHKSENHKSEHKSERESRIEENPNA